MGWKSSFRQNYRTILAHRVPSFATMGLSRCVAARGNLVAEEGTSKLREDPGLHNKLRCIWGLCLGPCLRRRRRIHKRRRYLLVSRFRRGIFRWSYIESGLEQCFSTVASIIPRRERPEKTTICYKISLVQLITNLNVILYLSTCNTVYISVLILLIIIP